MKVSWTVKATVGRTDIESPSATAAKHDQRQRQAVKDKQAEKISWDTARLSNDTGGLKGGVLNWKLTVNPHYLHLHPIGTNQT